MAEDFKIPQKSFKHSKREKESTEEDSYEETGESRKRVHIHQPFGATSK